MTCSPARAPRPLRISDTEPIPLAIGKQFSFGQEYGTQDIRVSLSQALSFDGKAAVIHYTVRNVSENEPVIRIGSCGNVQGNGVVARGGGFVSNNGTLSTLVFPGGYPFDGNWCGTPGENNSNLCYTDQNCNMSWYWYLYLQPGETEMRSVVIATGLVQPCSVFFEPNGGVNRNKDVGTRQERLALAGCSYPLPPTPFERGGFRFLGWSLEEDTDEVAYLDEDTIPAADIYDALTLYAVWEDKAAQVIQAEDLVLEYGDTGVELDAASTDGKISFAVKTGFEVLSITPDTGVIATFKPGTAVVTVRAAATNDYNAAEKDVTITVNPKSLRADILSLSPDSFVYDGEYKRPSISVHHGALSMLAERDYTIDPDSVLSAKELGEYRITINGKGNYTGSVSALWRITRKSPVVQISPRGWTYDGASHPLVSVDAHTGGTLEFSLNQSGTYSSQIPAAKNAGTYTVWYRVVGDEEWMDLAPASCSVTVAQKQVTVSGIRAVDKVYDGTAKAPLRYDEAVISGLCAGDTVTVRSAEGLFDGVDVRQDRHVSISAVTLGGADAGNYWHVTTQLESSASITPRPITITAKDQLVSPVNGSITQGTDQVTISGSGLSGTDSLGSITLVFVPVADGEILGSITPSAASIIRQGSTVYTTSNYEISYQPGKMLADRIELELHWTDLEFVYDGEEHQPTATVTGTLGGEVLTVTVTGAQVDATPEGKVYTATATELSGINAACYKLPEKVTQTFVIKPKSLEGDSIRVEYRPKGEPAVIGPVPADGRSYGFKSITVYDGTQKLVKDRDYTLDCNYSSEYGPHTVRIIGKGNYKGTLSHDWTMIGSGGISADTEIRSGGAPIYWTNASESLAEALLDDDERELLDEYGAPAEVYLQIRPAVISSRVASKARQLGETVGANYDISLIKRVGNEAVKITDTDGRPIQITLDIPKELQKAPVGFYRSFSLIHLHGGAAEVLAQGTGSSFSFVTTSFSAYAISYRDIALPPNSSPPTGDTASLPLWSTMLLLSAAGILILSRRRKKT